MNKGTKIFSNKLKNQAKRTTKGVYSTFPKVKFKYIREHKMYQMKNKVRKMKGITQRNLEKNTKENYRVLTIQICL